jgi:hypothetical protein
MFFFFKKNGMDVIHYKQSTMIGVKNLQIEVLQGLCPEFKSDYEYSIHIFLTEIKLALFMLICACAF